jgi:predicted nucleotidyltransferase
MPTNDSEARFGLQQTTIDKINRIFSTRPHIEAVTIYGSRAKGTFRNGSDIDLTIEGDTVTLSELLKLENELDDLLLPYKIDISLLHQIDDPELLDHIRRAGVVFYEKEGKSVRHGDRRPES